MNLSVILTFQAIENLLNQTFGEVLHEGNTHNPGGIITYVRVFKTDRIKIYRQGDQVVSLIPVKVRVSMRKTDPFLLSLIKDLSNVEKTSFDILVEFRTSLSLEEKGKLISSTTGHFSWVNKPKVGIGLVRIKISEVVKPALEKELLALTKEIDANITETVNLPSYAGLALDELKKIQEIQTTRPKIDHLSDWFIPQPLPSPILAGKIKIQEKGIILPTGFEMGPVVFLGTDKPKFEPPDFDLPPIELREDINDSFSIPIETRISYSVLANELSNQNFELPSGKEKIKIEAAQFSPENDFIKVNTLFQLTINRNWLRLSVRGEAEMKSQIEADQEGQQVSLKEFQLTLKDLRPWWARLIYSLNRSSFQKEISQSIESAIDKQIENVKEEVSELLHSYPLEHGLHLQGTLDQLSPKQFQIRQDFLGVKLQAEGKMELMITELEPDTKEEKE